MIQIRDSYRAPGQVRVTWWLLFINFLSFLASTYSSQHSLAQMIFMGGILPAEYSHPDLVLQMEPLQQSLRINGLIPLIWHQFLHGGWWHLISNCAVLYVFGPNVEAYMGRWRFLLFYLTCGCAGGMLQILSDLDSTQYIIGGSGAAFGLFGAYLMIFPNNYIRITIGNIHRGNYKDVMIPVKVILVFYAATQIMDAILPSPVPRNIAYFSHLGGFAAGYFISKGRGSLGSTRRNFKVFMGGKARRGGS